MARYSPSTIGGWSYPVGLYLYGQYLVYQRTHDARYLSYIKSYVDRFVDSGGNIGQSFNNLDSMQAGRLLDILHHETGQARYQKAAKKIRDRLTTYPRTSDGGFWHSTSESRRSQLWADGVYMVNPFLVEYGKEFGDSAYTNNEATKQLAVYGSHLQVGERTAEARLGRVARRELVRSGDRTRTRALVPRDRLVLHGDRQRPGRRPGRPSAPGPAARPCCESSPRASRSTRTRRPAAGSRSSTRARTRDNWTETSCSSMFTFALSRARTAGICRRALRTGGAARISGRAGQDLARRRRPHQSHRHFHRDECRELQLLHQPRPEDQ